MLWLSLVDSTTVYNKAVNMITSQLTNEKNFKLTKKLFAQILNIPMLETFYEVSNEQVLQMFKEIGYQPILTKISDFKKSCLPCI